jgi:hypothetical protein
MLPPAGGHFSSTSQHREILVLPTTVRLDGRFLWASLTHLRCRSKVLPNHPCLSQHFFIVWVRLATNNGATRQPKRTLLQRLRAYFGGGWENRTLTKTLQRSQAPITSIPQKNGWRGRDRTYDRVINSHLIYRWSTRQKINWYPDTDSNRNQEFWRLVCYHYTIEISWWV